MCSQITMAVIGVIGAVIGSLSTLAGQWLIFYLKQKAEKKKDQPRKDLLIEMLESKKDGWRELETLKHVIGADEETTKRLLIEIGARASENGKPIRALMKYQPLPKKIVVDYRSETINPTKCI